MIRNNDFILRTIKDVPYILPIGQALCDFKKGIQTNETGMFIWKCLAKDVTKSEIINSLLVEYGLNPSLKDKISYDVTQFLNILANKDMLFDCNNTATGVSGISNTTFTSIVKPDLAPTYPVYKTLHIAGISINLCGPVSAWSKDFNKFYGEAVSSPDISVFIVPAIDSVSDYTGNPVIKNNEITIYENNDMYLLYFENSSYIKELHLYKSGRQAYIHCLDNFNSQAVYDIFHAIRPCFLFHAVQKGITAIHSASIMYKEKVWLFSAPSQTGKSTHTSLWHKLFNSKLINGDVNLIGMSDNHPVVYGSPWCGTSKISTTGQFALGGIILLKQAPVNEIIELTKDRQCFLVLQRSIAIPLNEEIYDMNLNLISTITDLCLVAQLNCTPDDEAAITMKNYIDSNL